MNDGIDIQTIGIKNMPKPRITGFRKRLRKAAQELKEGQCLRITWPKEKRNNNVWRAWDIIATEMGKVGHVQSKKQTDGSLIMWLWYEEKKS